MSDEHGMQMVWNAADVARAVRLLGAVVFVDVQRLASPEFLLECRGNRLVGLVHVREHGVAAGGRDLDRVETKCTGTAAACNRRRCGTRTRLLRTRRSPCRRP